ncbi:MAG: hypothetical protein KGH79_04455 [Patescibacteria group bacterium]|nr:hypothetical protein [Patescibacteria group bacterium]
MKRYLEKIAEVGGLMQVILGMSLYMVGNSPSFIYPNHSFNYFNTVGTSMFQFGMLFLLIFFVIYMIPLKAAIFTMRFTGVIVVGVGALIASAAFIACGAYCGIDSLVAGAADVHGLEFLLGTAVIIMGYSIVAVSYFRESK